MAYGAMFSKVWRVHRFTTKQKQDPKVCIECVRNECEMIQKQLKNFILFISPFNRKKWNHGNCIQWYQDYYLLT